MAFNGALQSIMTRFANTAGVTDKQYTAVLSALNSSTALQNQFNSAAASGRLRNIPSDAAALEASFDPKTSAIVLSKTYLEASSTIVYG